MSTTKRYFTSLASRPLYASLIWLLFISSMSETLLCLPQKSSLFAADLKK